MYVFLIFFHTNRLLHTKYLQFNWLHERYGAPGVRFNAFHMHQFKCFTSNTLSLSDTIYVSTGTNGLPIGLPLN